MKTENTTKIAKKTQASMPAAKVKRKSATRGQRSSPTRSPVPARTGLPDTQETYDQRRTSKKATIEALARRAEGAAITELMTATGWQEHSIRAALTGLRKAGRIITRERLDDRATRYRIAKAV
jgi:Protein of unknown function (DUF3489)